MISIIHDINHDIIIHDNRYISFFTKLFNINKKYRLISEANNFYTIISKNIRQKQLHLQYAF